MPARQSKLHLLLTVVACCISAISGFSPLVANTPIIRTKTNCGFHTPKDSVEVRALASSTQLNAAVPDLDTVALVAGQENYGLAIVLLGEAVWSFAKAPSLDHGVKTLVPASIAAVVLVALSGPMITGGEQGSVATGLWIATTVSVAMGGVYLARCLASYSPSPKEIPAFGVLVALAGFFSFSQNLVVDGFVTLPSIPLPTLPTIQLPF